MTEGEMTGRSDAFDSLALALSGGGFRATLFHLGVIRFLRAAGLLGRVSHIAAVSGGSILAGHLAVHWGQYCGTTKEFEVAERKILRFCGRDIRGRIVRRFPLLLLARFFRIPRHLVPRTTTDLLHFYLRKLFGDVNLADLKAKKGGTPGLSIVATDLTEPGLALFEADRVAVVPLGGGELVEYRNSAVPLALAVTASAAFPALFPALAISSSDLRLSEGYGVHDHTDGGVVDNQGLEAILASEGPWNSIIVSDASESSLSPSPVHRFGLIDTGYRATELMMAQIRRERYANLSEQEGVKSTVVKIDETAETGGASQEVVQAQLAHIRTDLDRFDEVEQSELVRHGFWIARECLGKPPHDFAFEPSKPSEISPSKVVDHLRGRFGWKFGLFSIRDGIWLLYAFGLLFALALSAKHVATASNVLVSAIRYVRLVEPVDRDDPHFLQMHAAVAEADSEFKDPVNDGFLVTSEHRVWDLRKLAVSTSETGVRRVDGPAFLTRVTELSRVREDTEFFEYIFETSGNIRVWLDGSDARLKIQLRGPKPVVHGKYNLSRFLGRVDCREVQVGDGFRIAILAEYLNAFADREDWWAGMTMIGTLERATMRIIFPRQMPFKNPTFLKYPKDSRSEAVTFDGKVLRLPLTEPELLWEVPDPVSGYQYRVNWEW